MNTIFKDGLFQALFFILIALSFMPHWACHYYRLETGSSFIIGSWSFSPLDSWISLLFYSILVLMNVVSWFFINVRLSTAIVSGCVHTLIGLLHAFRLIHPFRFEVFNLDWPLNSSFREALILLPLGMLCFIMARVNYKERKRIIAEFDKNFSGNE
jgi:hypothetical protein